MATKTAVAGFPGDWKKWLAVAGALAAAGILPQRWAKALSAASAVVILFGL